MNGISFDLSRKSSGYAIWRDREPISIGTVNLPAGFLGEQLALWSAHLDAILPGSLDWIAFEDARAVSKQHGMILFGMTGILHMEAWVRGIPILGFAQTTVKKTLTGSGRAEKFEMVARAKLSWPHLNVETDDQADALGVGLCFWKTQD
jgi:Holliday junction resolvasome RuvABC endonuclease subunit